MRNVVSYSHEAKFLFTLNQYTHSWLNRFRRLLIRWEKKVENYLAMLHFACAWITFRAAGVFG